MVEVNVLTLAPVMPMLADTLSKDIPTRLRRPVWIKEKRLRGCRVHATGQYVYLALVRGGGAVGRRRKAKSRADH